ncbi:hypothetical protein Tco_0603516 [Tanacetum coccineum]
MIRAKLEVNTARLKKLVLLAEVSTASRSKALTGEDDDEVDYLREGFTTVIGLGYRRTSPIQTVAPHHHRVIFPRHRGAQRPASSSELYTLEYISMEDVQEFPSDPEEDPEDCTSEEDRRDRGWLCRVDILTMGRGMSVDEGMIDDGDSFEGLTPMTRMRMMRQRRRRRTGLSGDSMVWWRMEAYDFPDRRLGSLTIGLSSGDLSGDLGPCRDPCVCTTTAFKWQQAVLSSTSSRDWTRRRHGTEGVRVSPLSFEDMRREMSRIAPPLLLSLSREHRARASKPRTRGLGFLVPKGVFSGMLLDATL